jgi:hypothetical protein
MRVIPYISIADIPFGCTEEVVISTCGVPHRREIDRLERLELVYESQTFRLAGDTGKLVEVTACSEYFEIDNCKMPNSKRNEVAFVELGYAVARLDQDSFLAHGFFVSPRFGIAFDPHFPPYLTIFARSELYAWQNAA